MNFLEKIALPEATTRTKGRTKQQRLVVSFRLPKSKVHHPLKLFTGTTLPTSRTFDRRTTPELCRFSPWFWTTGRYFDLRVVPWLVGSEPGTQHLNHDSKPRLVVSHNGSYHDPYHLTWATHIPTTAQTYDLYWGNFPSFCADHISNPESSLRNFRGITLIQLFIWCTSRYWQIVEFKNIHCLLG